MLGPKKGQFKIKRDGSDVDIYFFVPIFLAGFLCWAADFLAGDFLGLGLVVLDAVFFVPAFPFLAGDLTLGFFTEVFFAGDLTDLVFLAAVLGFWDGDFPAGFFTLVILDLGLLLLVFFLSPRRKDPAAPVPLDCFRKPLLTPDLSDTLIRAFILLISEPTL